MKIKYEFATETVEVEVSEKDANIIVELDRQEYNIGAFMFEVQELDALTDFDDKLWLTVIDTVTVHADGRMTFKFQGGTEIDA